MARHTPSIVNPGVGLLAGVGVGNTAAAWAAARAVAIFVLKLASAVGWLFILEPLTATLTYFLVSATKINLGVRKKFVLKSLHELHQLHLADHYYIV